MLFIKDIMTRDVKTIEKDRTIKEAARLMARSEIGSLVVTNNSKPIGIITEGDISRAVARGLDPQTIPVSRITKRKLIVVSPDIRVEEAAKIMAERKVKKLPVVEDGKLVGIVTQTDIVSSSFDLVTTLKELVRARYRPPDFQP